jgi:hypothetical protein
MENEEKDTTTHNCPGDICEICDNLPSRFATSSNLHANSIKAEPRDASTHPPVLTGSSTSPTLFLAPENQAPALTLTSTEGKTIPINDAPAHVKLKKKVKNTELLNASNAWEALYYREHRARIKGDRRVDTKIAQLEKMVEDMGKTIQDLQVQVLDSMQVRSNRSP